MKNRKNNKEIRVSFFKKLNRFLIICIIQFIIAILLTKLILLIFGLLHKAEGFDFAISVYTINKALIKSYMILNIITSIIIVQLPMHIVLKFLRAFEHIKNGDYSVRLRFRYFPGLKKSAARFNNMASHLQKTEMLSSDFINNFSHEMKTPISSITGFANLLKDDNLPKEVRDEYIDIILQESDNLSHLSKKILLLSKLEEQTEITEKSIINISEQIRLAVAATYHTWSEKNITIEAAENDYFTSGDRELLEHVWQNLIDNAIKFSPVGGEITIKIIPENEKLNISISNQGKPIPSENFSDIFKKFYQGDKSNTTKGNGLGLPMVKQIIYLHNGEISVKKSDNVSTVFEIILDRYTPSEK